MGKRTKETKTQGNFQIQIWLVPAEFGNKVAFQSSSFLYLNGQYTLAQIFVERKNKTIGPKESEFSTTSLPPASRLPLSGGRH